MIIIPAPVESTLRAGFPHPFPPLFHTFSTPPPRQSIEYIGIWEKVYNPDFNYGDFAIIKNLLLFIGV